MALLDWNESLELGVGEMDREHRELVAAMNAVHELATRGAAKAQIDAALVRLVTLTQAHFADEERHMEATGYPDRQRHKLIHVDMLKKLAEHHAAFRGGDGRVPQGLFDFLVHWLSAHIRHIDRKYAVHPATLRS